MSWPTTCTFSLIPKCSVSRMNRSVAMTSLVKTACSWAGLVLASPAHIFLQVATAGAAVGNKRAKVQPRGVSPPNTSSNQQSGHRSTAAVVPLVPGSRRVVLRATADVLHVHYLAFAQPASCLRYSRTCTGINNTNEGHARDFAGIHRSICLSPTPCPSPLFQ